MITKRGFLEVMQMADANEPKSFNDFTKITIKKRRISSATVSKRLDELLAAKIIEEVVKKSKTGRRIIAYRTTEKGKRVLELSEELQEAVAFSKAK